MRLDRNLLIGAASALAISALPLNLESAALGSFQLSSAYAKGGNGGGHGGGHGGGRGHGGSGSHGKSADAAGHGKSGSVRAGSRHADKLLGARFAKETRAERKRARDDVKMAKAEAKSLRARQVAALPDTALIPETKPEEKNLHARLAGLNSLKRNYHAYLNSQSPRMASIRAFVMASANLDIANANLDDAQKDFQALLDETDLQAYDPAFYDDATLQELQDRLDTLPEGTPESDALKSVLDSDEAKALAEAEDLADAAAVGTDDEALKQALLDAANKNRVAQYGDDYVNDDVMDWAKDVLGVGGAVGKIDEVRESLEDSQETLQIDSQ